MPQMIDAFGEEVTIFAFQGDTNVVQGCGVLDDMAEVLGRCFKECDYVL